MAQPISDQKVLTIDAELPRSNAVGASVATAFRDLYARAASLPYQSPGVERTAKEDSASHSGLNFFFAAFAPGPEIGRYNHGAGPASVEMSTTLSTLLADGVTNYISAVAAGLNNQVGSFPAKEIPLYTAVTAGGVIGTVSDKRPKLHLLDGSAGPLSELNLGVALAALRPTASIAVGSESSNTITVTITLKDANGVTLDPGEIRSFYDLEIWLSDAVDGWETGTVPSGGLSVSTGTQEVVLTAGKRLRVASDANGVIGIDVAETGVNTWYLAVVINDQTVVYSPAITFT